MENYRELLLVKTSYGAIYRIMRKLVSLLIEKILFYSMTAQGHKNKFRVGLGWYFLSNTTTEPNNDIIWLAFKVIQKLFGCFNLTKYKIYHLKNMCRVIVCHCTHK